jgi:hypothetical protein
VGANPAESLELQRRAAEQLLRSGHMDAGLKIIRTVLRAIGMNLPRTPQHALLSLLWQRLLTPSGLEFREREAAQVPAEDLSRIDTCWSAALGLVMVDAMRAADFQSRNLRLSLLAGEPVRIVRALSLEACFSSAAGNRSRRRTSKLLDAATSLAARVNCPEALGTATLAAGTAAWFHGQFKRCLELSEQAEAIYREQCQGVSWELCTAQHFALRSLVYLGELPLLLRRLPALLKEAQERGDLFAETNLRTRIAYLARLCSDQSELARDELCRAIERWSQQAFHSQHYYELVGQVEIALYAAEGSAAWEHLTERWPAMTGSLILRNRPTMIEALQVRARAALAAAATHRIGASSVPAPQSLLRQAAEDARRIAREHTPWSDPLAHLIQAGIAATQRNAQRSLALLEQAETQFAQCDMCLYHAVARRRRGQVMGGEAGRSLVAAADRWMSERLIKRPERMAAMLAPGRWG